MTLCVSLATTGLALLIITVAQANIIDNTGLITTTATTANAYLSSLQQQQRRHIVPCDLIRNLETDEDWFIFVERYAGKATEPYHGLYVSHSIPPMTLPGIADHVGKRHVDVGIQYNNNPSDQEVIRLELRDNEAPKFTSALSQPKHVPLSLECTSKAFEIATSQIGYRLLPIIRAEDNCAPDSRRNVKIDYEWKFNQRSSSPNDGIFTLKWTASDPYSHSTSIVHNIIIQDLEPPRISDDYQRRICIYGFSKNRVCPAKIVDAYLRKEKLVTDNCDPTGDISLQFVKREYHYCGGSSNSNTGETGCHLVSQYSNPVAAHDSECDNYRDGTVARYEIRLVDTSNNTYPVLVPIEAIFVASAESCRQMNLWGTPRETAP